MGKPVITSSVEEPECLGASILVSVAIGAYKGLSDAIKDMVRTRDKYWPRPEHSEVYAQYFRLYEELCYSLDSKFKKIASLH
jgi:ribulose kinase